MIIATHNRSNVLKLCLQSLQSQTFEDWEALVIGDGCTDDSASVVAELGDDRISWFALPVAFGEQSGPNSVGARLARGTFIAWLNHDDFWFREHLSTMIESATSNQADFVASGWIAVEPCDESGAKSGHITATAQNSRGSRIHISTHIYPASTWLVRSELVREIGDWHAAKDLCGLSSQEYMYRCWAIGARLLLAPEPTVLAIQSGRFEGAYASRRSLEHDLLAPRIARSTPAQLLEEIGRARYWTMDTLRNRGAQLAREKRLGHAIVARILNPFISCFAMRFGVGPSETRFRLMGFQRGQFIARLSKKRGLE